MPNEASKAKKRLKAEGLFDRYIKGKVIDIGGGNDPITEDAKVYDSEFDPKADAQTMVGEADDSYDTVFSAHCLEHLRRPEEALKNWWRILKPGGHLIVIAPEENLYEAGYWPSLHNTDHKITLTLSKASTWSPAGYCLTDLVKALPDHYLLSARIIDSGYDYALLGSAIDQTEGEAEAACEIIVQKVAQEPLFKTNLKPVMLCPKCNRMELIFRGKLPNGKLDLLCGGCGLMGTVEL